MASKKVTRRKPPVKKVTRRKPPVKKAPAKKRHVIKKTAPEKMRAVKRVTTLTEAALIGELKSKILGTIGKAYTDAIQAKTKREKAYFQKIIVANKTKLKKIS